MNTVLLLGQEIPVVSLILGATAGVLGLIVFAVGFLTDDAVWSRVAGFFREVCDDIEKPNPIFPGPVSRFVGRLLGVRR